MNTLELWNLRDCLKYHTAQFLKMIADQLDLLLFLSNLNPPETKIVRALQNQILQEVADLRELGLDEMQDTIGRKFRPYFEKEFCVYS